MNSLQILLDRFWVTRRLDRQLYQEIRSDLEDVQKFVREYPGWRLVQNEYLIRLEKIPAYAEAFMGIQAFTSKMEYILLCALLIFLEEKEDGEAFLLSELTDRIEMQMKEVEPVSWTDYSTRRSLIHVMKWSEEIGLVVLHEGNLDSVSGGMKEEVLYENTGLSRYLAVSYPFDCSGFSKAEDYEQIELAELDMDRGHFRINRVYRRLLLSPAMYWHSGEDPDALYLRNQRAWVAKYLNDYTGWRLDIHRSAAFLLREEDSETYGKLFPDTSTLSDIVLLICGMLRRTVTEFNEEDCASISMTDFEALVHQCVRQYAGAWSKEYRETPEDRLCRLILAFMTEWSMAEYTEERVLLKPAAFLYEGSYGELFDSHVSKPKAKPKRTKNEEPAMPTLF